MSSTTGGQSVTQLEGEAIGRFMSAKVVLLYIGQRGIPLGSKEQIDECFKERSLEPVVVDSVEAIPGDTRIIVTMGTKVDAQILERAPQLELVAVAFSGTDHIDVAACRARGVKVVNVPGYSTDSTAELAIGLVISHLRRLQECHRGIQAGEWPALEQEELQSKAVGIIGTGKIGLRLAELLKAFKVRGLLAYSLSQDAEFAALGGKFTSEIATVFLNSDIVFVCVPLTEESRSLVSKDLMSLMKPDSLIVNVSRGGVVDEAALAVSLKKGHLRAALDVFLTEPLPSNSPLRDLPQDRLLMTPHIGYQSQQSLARRLDITVKNILAYLAGRPVNVVV